MHCIANDNDSFDFGGLSRDEYIDEFYNYYSNMIPYSVSIKAVPCSRNSAYDNYSESEKRNKLLESFDAWKYSESSHSAVTAPLSDFIVKLIEKRENDNSQKTNSVNTNSQKSAESGGGIYGDYDKAYLTSDMVYYADAYIGYVDISGGVLNFRSAPSTGSDVLLTLAKDQSIFVQYEGKDWVFGSVNYNNSKYFGYASKQYIRREYRDYQTPYEELNK